MNRSFVLLLVLLVTLTLACDRNEPGPTGTQTKPELLKSTLWKLDRVTTPDGQTISKGRLNFSTQVLFDLNMEFKDPDITRAIDSQSKQVVNGGTWQLTDNETILDVKVTGFTGKFTLTELSKTRLVLGNPVPVDGTSTEVRMEFSPAQ